MVRTAEVDRLLQRVVLKHRFDIAFVAQEVVEHLDEVLVHISKDLLIQGRFVWLVLYLHIGQEGRLDLDDFVLLFVKNTLVGGLLEFFNLAVF